MAEPCEKCEIVQPAKCSDHDLAGHHVTREWMEKMSRESHDVTNSVLWQICAELRGIREDVILYAEKKKVFVGLDPECKKCRQVRWYKCGACHWTYCQCEGPHRC